jgi:uncharacterized coiled-coil DUF342 family protein
MAALTVADIKRLAAEIQQAKVKAAATGSSEKLSYIVYNDDGSPNYSLTLAAALFTIPGISPINRLRLLAIYNTSSAGGYDDLYQSIKSLENQIKSVQDNITVIEAQLDGVDDAISKISNLNNQLVELRSLYNTLNTTVTDLSETVNEIETIVDSIDIESLTKKVNTNTENITTLTSSLDAIDKRVQKLEQGSGGGSSTGELTDRVNKLEQDVQTLNEKLIQYDATIEQLNYNIEQANLKAQNAENIANGLNYNVSKNTSNISAINISINSIKNDITSINKRIDSIITGGDVDLSDYVTKTELSNELSSMFSSLGGATVYNIHLIGWHDDIELEFNPETYSDANNNNEYFEQYGIVAAKEITTKEQLLAISANGDVMTRYFSEIMYVESIDELYNNMQAHAVIISIGYGKPKALAINKVENTIYIDTYWAIDNGIIARFELTSTSLKVIELFDIKNITDKISTLESTINNHESRISALERN